jgi:hypothetical protein
MIKLFWTTVIILLSGCATCPPATEKNIQKWERKTKFRASVNDSCNHVRMLAMARKY